METWGNDTMMHAVALALDACMPHPIDREPQHSALTYYVLTFVPLVSSWSPPARRQVYAEARCDACGGGHLQF
jgi:hypothetical protein